MKLNRLQLRKLIIEAVLLKEGDDHHKTTPDVDKNAKDAIVHHAGPKTSRPLLLKYIKPQGGHYSLELKNAKFIDGHVRFDAKILGDTVVGVEGHFEIPINTKSDKKDHVGIIQGTEINHPHGEVSLEIAHSIPRNLGAAQLILRGTAGTDFAGHDEYGWSIGLEGSLPFGDSNH